MPEILERIFSHLSPTVLRRSSSLVCKEWYQIVQRLILRSNLYSWKGSTSTHTVEELARELRGVGALQLTLNLAYPSSKASIEVFLAAISHQTPALPLTTGVPLGWARATSNNLYQVYDMILNGLDDSTNFLSQILPWLNQLTFLRLGDLTVGFFPLGILLAGCPQLLYLHFHGLSKTQRWQPSSYRLSPREL